MLRLLTTSALVLLALCGVREATSRAHHKVHNLALYPERHSWCQATPIRQEIAASDPECAPTTIDNVVCLGACFSYAVPRAQDDVLIEPYCDACRPTVAAWTVVSLNCTRALTGERYLAPKNVELIANCSCVDCHSGARAAHAADDDHSATDSAEEEDESMEDRLTSNSVHLPPASLDTGKNNGEEEQEEGAEEPGAAVPSHHLRSASAEARRTVEDDLMIKDNKISPDDDDDNHAHHRHHGR